MQQEVIDWRGTLVIRQIERDPKLGIFEEC